MPKVTVNDTEIEVPAGINMIEAAALGGIKIPHYCYHPHLSVAGNCRMCLVDVVAGGRGPDIACNMAARDGLHIRTDTASVKKMEKSVMEFLLANHPLDCPICDQSGECRLQDYYMDYGAYSSRLNDEKVGKRKRQDIGDLLVLDAERCVQCSRCVRFGDEVTETGELQLMNRGNHTEIGVFPGTRITHAYQGNLADICPVGALTNKDFRFERRVWYLKETGSVCSGCATGCNIEVCHQEGEVFRYLPRRNDAVNRSWMCDPGRMSYKEIADGGRLLSARKAGRSVSLDVTLTELAARLKSATRVGVVLGARATNEANWALLRLVRTHLKNAALFHVAGNDADRFTYQDKMLVDGDKNPNSAGVRLLAAHDGAVGDAAALTAALADLQVVLVLEDDVVHRLDRAIPGLVYLGTAQNRSAKAAEWVLPVAHAVEQDGSYVNRSGRVQRLRRAVNPPGDALPAYTLLDRLGAALGAAPGTAVASAAFNSMARSVTRLRGMEFKALGVSGVPLAPEAEAPATEVRV